MNYLKLAGAALALSFTSQISAQEYQFVADSSSPETKFCVSVGNNDVDTMRSKLMQMGLGDSIRRNINSITCNDMPVAKFAYKYGANDTFHYLNSRSSPSNRVTTTVTISDIAMTDTDSKPTLIYVSAGR